jgi:Zn-dependent peptidase ImmA (M78 family)/transcriptional regulator with XRE-family HTH domain
LREIRLAKGLTLDELAARMGDLVTKQALSKYETGKSQPRPSTLVALAQALEVKTAELLAEPEYSIECLQYRTRAPLRPRAEERVEAALRYRLEQRLRLEDRISAGRRPAIPGNRVRIHAIADAEQVAVDVRSEWGLGRGAIANLTEVLERQAIHVFEMPGEDDFDGLAAVATTDDGELRAVGIAENPDTDGDRQRFNLAHEIGHVILEAGDLDEEMVANRFAGAFLVPQELILDAFGVHRSDLSFDELLLLKQSWGVSVQCILHRLRDLEVITQAHYDFWFREIAALGYRKTEPVRLPREQSTWVRRSLARATAEGLMTQEQAATYVTVGSGLRPASDGMDRRSLMKLSLEDRREVLRAQAERLADYYDRVASEDWQEADLDEP